jgi:sortase A
MANRPRRVTVVLRAVEMLLLTVGIVSVAWYATAHTSAVLEQAALSRELERLSTAQRAVTTSTTTADDFRLKAEATRVEKAEATGVMKGLIGRIEVRRIKMSALAREGVDVRTLRVAVGHIPGTALPGQPGNAGFAAHRDTFFRPLKSVREGDEVVVTTPRGVYRYAVTGTRIVEPQDLSVLDPTTDAILTLVTCYPFEYIGNAPRRFIVRAALREQ